MGCLQHFISNFKIYLNCKPERRRRESPPRFEEASDLLKSLAEVGRLEQALLDPSRELPTCMVLAVSFIDQKNRSKVVSVADRATNRLVYCAHAEVFIVLRSWRRGPLRVRYVLVEVHHLFFEDGITRVRVWQAYHDHQSTRRER